MGMEVRIAMEAPDEAAARRAGEAAFAAIAALDARLSDYRPDSDLRAIERAAPHALQVHPDVFAVLSQAVDVARATHGAFDPTIAPVVVLWREARRSGRLPAPDRLADARALVDWSRLHLEKTSGGFFVRLPVAGMRLDLGGIAKGYILQRAMDTLRDHGITAALIDAGGDIVAGTPPRSSRGWVAQVGCDVGLAEHVGPAELERAKRGPAELERAKRGRAELERANNATTVSLANAALATSGATAQFVVIDGVRYSHVVDPSTGLGLTSHRTVHVRAPDGATADAWATALSVLTDEELWNVTLPVGVTFCRAGGGWAGG